MNDLLHYPKNYKFDNESKKNRYVGIINLSNYQSYVNIIQFMKKYENEKVKGKIKKLTY